MGIFAGAPRTRTPDPWIVIAHPNPKPARPVPPSLLSPAAAAVRASGRQHANRMSRNVDAVLDGVGTPVRQPASGDASGDDEPDYLAPLLHRTLRRRGLSDSSIHSTFAAQAPEEDAPPQTPLSRAEANWLESGSVLQALSRRVQSFRSGVGAESSAEGGGGNAVSGSEFGTSPPAAAASPIAVGVKRRSSRASSRPHDTAHSPPKPQSGFGFLANLVPTGEAAELARSLREQDDELFTRTYRLGGTAAGERDYM
ncbi:hypothetical protein K438DRAFT_1814403 [Mycena galopus ATCC 62051]|nr:hypothetical protein K438DRAFT_1814403 [Mycena galopus ATCC 62051]